MPRNYYNYFTEIEEHFVKRRGKNLLISPMDWGLIAAWRDAGVPLHVALRGIDIAMDGFLSRKRRGSSKVNSLCYCHDSVMEQYAEYLESHVGETPAEPGPSPAGRETAASATNEPAKQEIHDLMSERISEIKNLLAKQSLGNSAAEGIERVLSRLEEIAGGIDNDSSVDSESLERDLGMADELLVTSLRALVPPEEAAEWEKEAKKELRVYRKRLPGDTYKKIVDSYMRGKIHKRFGIGELSLFHL